MFHPHLRAESGLTSARGVVAIRPASPADRLDRLARRPLQRHRQELRVLARRLRTLEALDREHEPAQLELAEVA